VSMIAAKDGTAIDYKDSGYDRAPHIFSLPAA
jgi:hypothetical protein